MKPGDYSGRYIRYGIREHGMAAAMNGIAMHGGLQPVGATFFVFTDYARPAMRIAALVIDPGRLCDDARFDRPWRGRADAPAGRAPGGAPRHAEHARLPPGRRDGDGGVLAARAGAHRRPDGAGADPPEPRAGAHDRRTRTISAPSGAYEISPAAGKPLATIFASGSEVEIAHQRAEASEGQGHRRARRLGAVAGAVPRASATTIATR